MNDPIQKEKRTNYEILAEEARARLSSMDMQEIRRRTGIEPQDGAFRVSLLGRRYSVSAEDGAVTLEDGTPADHNVCMILYDLLGYSEEGASPSGEYTQVQNLAKVVSTVKYAGQGMHDRTAQSMDGKDEQLIAACEALGGTPWGKGDVSYMIPLYGELRFVFSFWDSDDEFPASANVLFDSSSLQYMHYETLWYCLGHIFSRIAGEMEKAD
ncbi:MAG: DUF3786 domain-containing protein [Oscillospiraceae bacterium]|nr:DUF3786 domain-containing protein [Oscillospiraceae bacterium]